MDNGSVNKAQADAQEVLYRLEAVLSEWEEKGYGDQQWFIDFLDGLNRLSVTH